MQLIQRPGTAAVIKRFRQKEDNRHNIVRTGFVRITAKPTANRIRTTAPPTIQSVSPQSPVPDGKTLQKTELVRKPGKMKKQAERAEEAHHAQESR